MQLAQYGFQLNICCICFRFSNKYLFSFIIVIIIFLNCFQIHDFFKPVNHCPRQTKHFKIKNKLNTYILYKLVSFKLTSDYHAKSQFLFQCHFIVSSLFLSFSDTLFPNLFIVLCYCFLFQIVVLDGTERYEGYIYGQYGRVQ